GEARPGTGGLRQGRPAERSQGVAPRMEEPQEGAKAAAQTDEAREAAAVQGREARAETGQARNEARGEGAPARGAAAGAASWQFFHGVSRGTTLSASPNRLYKSVLQLWPLGRGEPWRTACRGLTGRHRQRQQ